GLASKLAAGGAPPGGAPPGAYGQQQQQQYGTPGGPPPGAYGQAPPGQQPYNPQQPPPQGAYGGAYGGQPPASAPPSGPPGQYGGAPPQGPYGGAPPQGQFGGPPQLNPYGGAPPQGQYGAPPQGQYGGAPQGQYGAPPQGQYGGAPPQGQYGAPPQQGGEMGVSRNPPHPQAAQRAFPVILNKLNFIVQSNQLGNFYPPQTVQQIADRVSRSVDFDYLTAQWKLQTPELAYDLASLALYDIVIYADDSGSMIAAEGGERVEDLNLIVSKVAEISSLFDQDGISVRFMNNDQQGNNIRTEAEASKLVRSVNYMGTTPLGTKLDAKVIQPIIVGPARNNSLPKPILVVVITDGEPVGEPRSQINTVISGAKQALASTRYGPTAVAFQFAQVGKDAGAQKFLAALDNDPVVGKMIDCTSYFELEQQEMAKKGVSLTPGMWLVKLMVGAVDNTYDETD
ncbi:uncharacterized protein EV422DRAFT_597261, partial [Fimicolochytrium jonesii]|uniref:uncharacterized protein n=1 Tax=Fimicolochytrium jonesii TaxID=1396493 RepID=UPI0022FE935B